MNETRRVVGFVTGGTALLFLVSLFSYLVPFSWSPFDRVNLLSDLIHTNRSNDSITTSSEPDSSSTAEAAVRRFDLYQTPGCIIGFNPDSLRADLPQFLAKLHQLRTTKQGKVRIAYFGDSMIEGDLMTQTLRQLLQTYFGGVGVGYVPITSIVSGFRQTVRAEYSGGWQDRNFKANAGKVPLFLSGHAFSSNADWVRFTDRTIGDSSSLIEKILFCAPDPNASILVNDEWRALTVPGSFNRVPLISDANRTLKLVANTQTPILYGVSFESPSGVVLDNFSFRGITGIELNQFSVDWLRSIQQAQSYDLVIFQYGVNLLFRPMDKDFRWYGRAMKPVIDNFKQAFPTADVLVVSTADRAFRYQGKYASAIGIDSLVKVQAQAAYQSNVAFYNQFATMGGTNSIVDWASRKPAWAGRDHIHPNGRGAAWLGESMYRAILKEYDLYVRSLRPTNNKIKSGP